MKTITKTAAKCAYCADALEVRFGHPIAPKDSVICSKHQKRFRDDTKVVQKRFDDLKALPGWLDFCALPD
jgi:hypothetical protein